MSVAMPATLSVRGIHRGRPDIEVTWTRGVLTGDPFAILDIEDAITVGRQVNVPGIVAGTATISADAGSDLVVASIADVFDQVDAVDGVDPQKIPAGAES